jgi:uncharacterized ferritin-like protein (DUF455 family)
MHADYFARIAQALACDEPTQKCALVKTLQQDVMQGRAAPDGDVPDGDVQTDAMQDTFTVPPPGRPARPLLVHPRDVPRRRLGTPAGRAALLHAIAHIEFNAINLALDASCRFRDMPAAFHRDWLGVAAEEAEHFSLLAAHLRSLGHDYGDFAAHDGLWQAALATADDVLARMALVPRVMEARGLDVTPALRDKLAASGDQRAAQILDLILREEIGHVAIGDQWFRQQCQVRGLQSEQTFLALLQRPGTPQLHPPFNRPARLVCGFSSAELDALEAMQAPTKPFIAASA